MGQFISLICKLRFQQSKTVLKIKIHCSASKYNERKGEARTRFVSKCLLQDITEMQFRKSPPISITGNFEEIQTAVYQQMMIKYVSHIAQKDHCSILNFVHTQLNHVVDHQVKRFLMAAHTNLVNKIISKASNKKIPSNIAEVQHLYKS